MVGPILPALSGTAATAFVVVLSQPPVGLWWLGPVVLLPWLATVRTPKMLMLTGLVWGTLSGIGMGHWIATGLTNVGATPVQAFLGMTLCAFAITGIPGALYGLAAALARRSTRASWIAFAILVAAIDAFRGIESLLPWSLLGQSQYAAHGVAQLALIGGVPLVSGLLAGTSYAMAQCVARVRPFHTAWPPLVCYAVLLTMGLPWAETVRPQAPSQRRDLHVVALQPRLQPGDRWIADLQRANVALLSRRSLDAVRSAPRPTELVVWPETSVTVDLDVATDVLEELTDWLARFDAPLLLGGVRGTEDASRYRNAALWVETSGRIVDRFDKTRAVPLVERAPGSALERGLRRLIGASSVERLAIEGQEERPLRAGDQAFAVALCFEILYPGIVGRRVEDDVLAIVNLANDAWYGSSTPGVQQLAFASFRAIEHRRPVLRVADSGPSALIDPFGRVVVQLAPDELGSFAVRIEPSPPPSGAEELAIGALALLGLLLGSGPAGLAWWRQGPEAERA